MHSGRVNNQRIFRGKAGVDSQALEHFAHNVDIADVRNIGEDRLPGLRDNCGGQNRKRCVLAAAELYLAIKALLTDRVYFFQTCLRCC